MLKKITYLKIKIGIILMSFIFLFSLNLSADLNDGLVAYYPFTNGSTQDFSGNGNHGTNHGATPTTDRFGNENCSYYFDGVDDFINSNPLPDFENVTLSFWVKVTNLNNRNTIIWEGNSSSCHDLESSIEQDGKIIFDVKDNTSNEFFSNYEISLNNWVFVCLVADATNNKKSIYINDQIDKLAEDWNGTANVGYHHDLQIGRKSDSPGESQNHYNGKIDDIRIYNRALSEPEIQQLFHQNGWNSINSGLVAYYPFTGGSIEDFSGNGNDGTNHGATLCTDRFGDEDCAYEFDGEDDFINIGSDTSLNFNNSDDFSIVAWVKTTTSSADDVIAGKRENDYTGYHMRVNGFAVNKGGNGFFPEAEFIQQINNGEWQFLCGSYKADTNIISAFVNDNLPNTFNNNGENPYTLVDFYIGASVESGRNFSGKIDDIRIYNRALSQSEIQQLYQMGNDYAYLNGTVTNNQSGNPIENAQICLTSSGTTLNDTSNANGDYNFSDLSPGQYNIEVTANGYQTGSRTLETQAGNVYTEDFSLISDSCNAVQVEDMTFYADNITENPPNYFTLAGNVNANDLVYFDGEINIDKRANLSHPELTGDCAITINDIQGEDIEIYGGGFLYKFSAQENSLTIKAKDFFFDMIVDMGGFPLTLASIKITQDEAEIKAIPKFPYPLDAVLTLYLDGESIPTIIENVCFTCIYSKNNGISYTGTIDDQSVNFGVFALQDVNLYFDTNQDIFGGGFMLKIPGLDDNNGSKMEGTDIENIPVLVKDEMGNVVDSTSFKEFVKMQRFLGSEFLKVGVQVEFVSGAINSLVITVGSKIPIANTGLFITEMSGGVEDLQSDDWKIIANIDVETGLEIPSFGSPVKLDDFGVSIHPMSYLKGSGSFLIFDYETSNGFIEFDGKKNSLVGEGNLNLYDIVIGKTTLSLQGGNFNGGGNVTVKTPSDLPWYLNWAENYVFGSTDIDIKNEYIQSQMQYSELSLAQKLEFGKEDAPWFHYYIGKNYGSLHQIWKGMRDGKQTVEFQVDENTAQILLVAGNDNNLFDFTVTDPSGQVYDYTNTYYEQFSDTKQTLMVINSPQEGDWEFSTTQTGDITLETKGLNQRPTTLVHEPGQLRSRDNQVTLNFTDYADTLDVEVFYDTDRKNFDGTYIQEFELINNATVDFTWQNSDVQNGEYFIYARIDDGYNSPVMQYAPGSILVENDLNIETPQNLSAVQTGDSVQVQWDAATYDNTFAATVYYKNISDNFTGELSVCDTNSVYLKDLDYGQEYEIWCCFINNSGTISPKSNSENVIFTSSSKNNPPYFTMNPDSVWHFIVDEEKTFELSANDADGNNLDFAAPDDTLGLQINGDYLSWTPQEEDRGVYNILLTVTDGSATDSLYQEIVVYTQEQVDVYIAFSSLNLYESDNMFVKIKNFRCSDYYQNVTLENLNTSSQTTLNCRKVNDFDYIGEFALSYRHKTDLSVSNGDTIEVSYSYNGDDYTTTAYYDSLAQPSDNTPPAAITDITSAMINTNELQLSWTAPGDDGTTGNAFKYDIRYAFSEIATEDDYLVANKITDYPLPSMAGEMDSVIIDLNDIDSTYYYDKIYFSIKAEDEMQNRAGLSNCAEQSFLIAPTEITAAITDIYNIALNWQEVGSKGFNQKDSVSLEKYRLFRQYNNQNLQVLVDSITTTNYIDSLYSLPDGSYKYGLQAVYSIGESDTIYSNVVEMDRFEGVRVLCTLQDTSVYDSISFTMTGMDTIYSQVYNRVTNHTGLVLMDSVYKTEYSLEISKPDYDVITDTINITASNNEFVYDLEKITGIDNEHDLSPYDFKVHPNPFHNIAAIDYNIPHSSRVKIQIYNIKGRLVETIVDEYQPPGEHSIEWNSKGLSSGIYFYSMEINGANKGIKKMIIMK